MIDYRPWNCARGYQGVTAPAGQGIFLPRASNASYSNSAPTRNKITPTMISVRRFCMKWPRGLILFFRLSNGFHNHMENHNSHDHAERDRESLLESGVHDAFATP